ncbi:hypothetical protein [Acididesulfobacillus acetoxydans]|uniref:hypothetical protein n=1 Tax=Acididesulfobacillus acetoxydans TaxID=1561005 RepID=UPI001F110FC3|nr:hypothetical protein [Acididesulfobacillus acetoxydans]
MPNQTAYNYPLGKPLRKPGRGSGCPGYWQGAGAAGVLPPAPRPCGPNVSRQRSKAQAWLLLPAAFGTVIALVAAFSPRKERVIRRWGGPIALQAAVSLYTGFGVLGVAVYVFQVLRDSEGQSTSALARIFPLALAIPLNILFFASVYNFMYQYFPQSFKGDIGTGAPVELFSFLYLSMTAISTGGMGDILPTAVSTRMLLSMETLFNLFVLSMGISLFGEVIA